MGICVWLCELAGMLARVKHSDMDGKVPVWDVKWMIQLSKVALNNMDLI